MGSNERDTLSNEHGRAVRRILQVGSGGLLGALIAYEGNKRVRAFAREKQTEIEAFEAELQAKINETTIVEGTLRDIKMPFDFGSFPVNIAAAIALRDNNPLRRVDLRDPLAPYKINSGSAHPLRESAEIRNSLDEVINADEMLYVRRMQRGVFGIGTCFDVVGYNHLFSPPVYPKPNPKS